MDPIHSKYESYEQMTVKSNVIELFNKIGGDIHDNHIDSLTKIKRVRRYKIIKRRV